MLRPLVAYDANGNIVATLNVAVRKDEDGKPEVIDFEAHEVAGGRLRDIWENSEAVGSATWPEWIGPRAHDFKVELDPNPGKARARIAALVHKKSGHRRSRADIEAAIAERINEKKAEAKKRGDDLRRDLRKRTGMTEDMIALVDDPEPDPADLRDLVGGPGKPLLLDEDGRTRPRPAKSQRPALPVVKRGRDHPR